MQNIYGYTDTRQEMPYPEMTTPLEDDILQGSSFATYVALAPGYASTDAYFMWFARFNIRRLAAFIYSIRGMSYRSKFITLYSYYHCFLFCANSSSPVTYLGEVNISHL